MLVPQIQEQIVEVIKVLRQENNLWRTSWMCQCHRSWDQMRSQEGSQHRTEEQIVDRHILQVHEKLFEWSRSFRRSACQNAVPVSQLEHIVDVHVPQFITQRVGPAVQVVQRLVEVAQHWFLFMTSLIVEVLPVIVYQVPLVHVVEFIALAHTLARTSPVTTRTAACRVVRSLFLRAEVFCRERGPSDS